MKKTISLLLSVLMLITTIIAVPFVSSAKDKKYDSFVYSEISKSEVKIVGIDMKSYDVTIPSKINGKKVTVIGKEAFHGCKIKNIVIPNTVKKIESDAFIYCSLLNNVVIPDSVTEIGASAFYKCENLDSIKLSKNLTKIGSGVLYLSKYYFDDKNWNNGALYLDNYLFNVKNTVTTLNIKKGTKLIADNAVSYCDSLKKVTIPKSVKYIGQYAFNSCYSLKNVSIENGVKNIGKYAFYNCISLKNIKIQLSVTSIGEYAFGYEAPDNANKKPIKMKNVTIKGYTNTAAEKYAKKNKIKFSSVILKTPQAKITAGKKKITVKYTKVSGASGFQVKYTKGKKTVTKTYKTSKSATKSIAKLKKGKYKVQVRAYYSNNKKQKAYSSWTKVKTVTVK